jgi:hypothetical protein
MPDAIDDDFGDDLTFQHLAGRPVASGAWVAGRVAGHAFEALVFRGHTDNPEWELGQSRISKLWVQRLADHKVVFHWDRGSDVPADDAQAAQVVDFLAAGLAEHAFGG